MTEAQRLKALWVPADFPCKPPVAAGDLVPILGVLGGQSGLVCQVCGQEFVQVGFGFFHPGTPSLAAALASC